MNQLPLAEESSNLLVWVIGGVSAGIAGGAGVLWKALESRHQKHTEALEARIKALEGAVAKLQEHHNSIVAQKDKDLSALRHERVALLSSLNVAESKLEAVLRHAKLRPLKMDDIQAIVGDPNDSHFGTALLERMENSIRDVRP